MTAVLVELAENVQTDYAAAFGLGRLNQEIQIVRGYIPAFIPGEQTYDVFQVFIAPEKEETQRLSRSSIKVDYTIAVGCCCRLRETDNATVDPLKLLIQQMADLFFEFGVTGDIAEWTKNDVYYWGDPERLKFDGAFFALWDLVFTGRRRRA